MRSQMAISLVLRKGVLCVWAAGWRATGSGEPRSYSASVLRHCHERGLIVISAGTLGNVVRLHLPLVATDAQLREGLSVLESALAAVCA